MSLSLPSRLKKHHGAPTEPEFYMMAGVTRVIIVVAFCMGSASLCLAQQTGSTDEYHRGYLWAQMHDIGNALTCAGVSEPFSKGCAAFVADQRTSSAEDAKSVTLTSRNPDLGEESRGREASCVVSIRLEQASNKLASCARNLDSSDGCRSEYRNVRETFDVYAGAAPISGEACK
jgi:hypothetical protein